MTLTPFVQDADFTLYCGDALSVLRGLPDESVHACVTSPPFFGLRDYQVDGQIGLEGSPEEWVATLVDVFGEVRRVLRSDGSCFIEIGDSYNSGTGAGRQGQTGQMAGRKVTEGRLPGNWVNPTEGRRVLGNTKVKDIIGQPFMLAFALRDAGWWWRGWYPWIKRNAMPESAKDRRSVCSSIVLHLAKSKSYFYDGIAVEQEAAWDYWGKQGLRKLDTDSGARGASMRFNEFGRDEISDRKTKWPRGWYDIPTVSNSLAICKRCDAYWERGAPETHCGEKVVQHYAAFAPKLVDEIIRESTSERGCCPVCGTPWARQTDSRIEHSQKTHNVRGPVDGIGHHRGAKFTASGAVAGTRLTTTLGWRPGCPCMVAGSGDRNDVMPEPVPCVVLDPFLGSGTTALVARKLGRHSIGIDLNHDYCRLAATRLQQLSLLTEASA